MGGECIKGAGGTHRFYGAAMANLQNEFIDSSMEILTPTHHRVFDLEVILYRATHISFL